MALNGTAKTVAWILGAAVTLVGWTVGTISYVDARAKTVTEPLAAAVTEEKNAHEKALAEIKAALSKLADEQRQTREALIRVETKLEANGPGRAMGERR